MRIREFPLLMCLLFAAGCSDSRSSATIAPPPADPELEPEVDPELEPPCEPPIIYQQLIGIDGRVVRVVLPWDYDGEVSTSHGERASVTRGGTWRRDYSTTRGSVSVSVSATHGGESRCPPYAEELEDHRTMPGRY